MGKDTAIECALGKVVSEEDERKENHGQVKPWRPTMNSSIQDNVCAWLFSNPQRVLLRGAL